MNGKRLAVIAIICPLPHIPTAKSERLSLISATSRSA